MLGNVLQSRRGHIHSPRHEDTPPRDARAPCASPGGCVWAEGSAVVSTCMQLYRHVEGLAHLEDAWARGWRYPNVISKTSCYLPLLELACGEDVECLRHRPFAIERRVSACNQRASESRQRAVRGHPRASEGIRSTARVGGADRPMRASRAAECQAHERSHMS